MVSSLRHPLKPGRWLVACVVTALLAGCSEPERPPNVLWIVWDTVRADRLGVYGGKPVTTPGVDRWAREARVFENAKAVAATTVPNHASMFTGLLPAEHDATNATPRLGDAYETIAERLSAGGYRTYLWAANPHLSQGTRFTRGFSRAEHPWDRVHQRRALALAKQKLGDGDGSGLAVELAQPRINTWSLKESGTLAQGSLLDWLDAQPDTLPWFAFLNYMEAHRPVVPARRFREQVMGEKEVERSYAIDRGWLATWRYTFGLREIPAEDLAVIAGTYDAAIAELDDLFVQLLDGLALRGALDDTVVILTSDHGEQLGEHHMLDHQYSLYEPLLRVPLIVHYPKRFAPGRDASPVTNADLFATVLELAGLGAAEVAPAHSISLLTPRAERVRLAEYRAAFGAPLRSIRAELPGFDTSPWQRRLRALTDDRHKLIWASDGRNELYDLADDPGETRDLYTSQPDLAQRMLAALDAFSATLAEPVEDVAPAPLPDDDRARLEALGYGADPPQDADQ